MKKGWETDGNPGEENSAFSRLHARMEKVISEEHLLDVEKDLGLFRDLGRIPRDIAQGRRGVQES